MSFKIKEIKHFHEKLLKEFYLKNNTFLNLQVADL